MGTIKRTPAACDRGTLCGNASEINLAELGLSSFAEESDSHRPSGPFSYFDARVAVTQIACSTGSRSAPPAQRART